MSLGCFLVVASVRNSFLYDIPLCVSPHFAWPFMRWWTFGLFPPFDIVNKAAINMGVQICTLNLIGRHFSKSFIIQLCIPNQFHLFLAIPYNLTFPFIFFCSTLFKKCLFIYFESKRERERESTSRGGAEREAERECQADSTLSTQSWMQGSILRTVRSWPEPKPRVRHLINWAPRHPGTFSFKTGTVVAKMG